MLAPRLVKPEDLRDHICLAPSPSTERPTDWHRVTQLLSDGCHSPRCNPKGLGSLLITGHVFIPFTLFLNFFQKKAS